ncbi:unnamed protein product, partial [marine sediment metagenome]
GVQMEEERIVTINNKQLLCLFCGSAEFRKVNTKLNEKWRSSFKASKGAIQDLLGHTKKLLPEYLQKE